MHLAQNKATRDIRLFVGLFILMTTLYSALDLSGFFIADFFKNNIVHILGINANDKMTQFHLIVYGFFVFKLLSIIAMISTSNTVKQIIYASLTFVLIGIESLLQIETGCQRYDAIKDTTACPHAFIVDPYASLIVFTFMLAILIPSLYKKLSEIK